MEEAPELTDEQYQRLLAFRTGLRAFLRWSEERAHEVGLTSGQHQLLLAVRGHPGGDPTVGDVAGYLMLRHHSAVGLVDRAEAAGLVARRHDPKDHRLVRLGLTRRGADLLARLSAQNVAELQRLGPQLDRLWTGLPERSHA
jgi:DNA-binding MarR family transcriptional regulator